MRACLAIRCGWGKCVQCVGGCIPRLAAPCLVFRLCFVSGLAAMLLIARPCWGWRVRHCGVQGAGVGSTVTVRLSAVGLLPGVPPGLGGCSVVAAVVGFSGSRSGVSAPLVQRVVRSVVASGKLVGVGCALGLDAQVISAVLALGGAKQLSVFAAFTQAGLGAWSGSASGQVQGAAAAGAKVVWSAGWRSRKSGRVAARLAARSQALVSFVQQARQGGAFGSAVVAFPMGSCPAGVVSASRWVGGSGSGTWATVALAAGLGVGVMVFCPQSALPGHWGGQWVRVSRCQSSVWHQAWRWRSPLLVAACPTVFPQPASC